MRRKEQLCCEGPSPHPAPPSPPCLVLLGGFSVWLHLHPLPSSAFSLEGWHLGPWLLSACFVICFCPDCPWSSAPRPVSVGMQEPRAGSPSLFLILAIGTVVHQVTEGRNLGTILQPLFAQVHVPSIRGFTSRPAPFGLCPPSLSPL